MTTPKQELLSYIDLAPDWDGPGSKPPTRRTIDAAIEFLGLIPASAPPPDTSVAADGAVSVYWKDGGIYINVVFVDGKCFDCLVKAEGIARQGFVLWTFYARFSLDSPEVRGGRLLKWQGRIPKALRDGLETAWHSPSNHVPGDEPRRAVAR